MNIEESKNLLGWVSLNKLYIDTHGECDYHNIHTAIETLLTAYEKEKKTSHYIQGQLDIANAKLVEEKEKNKEYKNLLINMVNQFAYEDNSFKTRDLSEQKIYTAGLSTLEDAFDLLDIDEGIKREDLWKLKEE